MKAFIVTKPDCPYCVTAKELLEKWGFEYNEQVVENRKQLQSYKRGATTVPQIWIGDEHIGGHAELVKYFSQWTAPEHGLTVLANHPDGELTTDNSVSVIAEPKKHTIFNVDNKGYETGDYPLFMGDDSGFKDTINVPYPVLDKLYQLQMSQIWNEHEIDLNQDRMDMINADPKVVDLMVKTILWQHLADSVASRAISGILLRYVTNSALEDWYNAVAAFESIHSRTYSHIIKQTFVDPNEALREGYASMEVVKRSNALVNAFDDLLHLPMDAPEDVAREKLYLAISTLYMLERVNFMASFAITFGIAERGLFQGISQDVVLICRDEILHAEGGRQIMKIEMEKHPEIFKKIKPQLQHVFDEIMREEGEWTDYLFSEGRGCPGISANSIKQYVKFSAQEVAQTMGLEHETVETDPLPYMKDYIDTSKVQEAAQEIQLTDYLLNAVLAPEDLDGTLAELCDKYYR